MNRTLKPLFYLFAVLLFTACGTNEEPLPLEYLESSEQVLEYKARVIQGNLETFNLQSVADEAKYDITVHKIIYRTEFQGETILASGLAVIPITSEPVPMIVINHGTIAADNEAPSNDLGGQQFFTWYASTGAIVVLPDYIGFGESSEFLHPYYNYEYSAGSVVDMMQASREFAQVEQITFDGRVLVTGYSEGGYVAMATHKMIQEQDIPEFEIMASMPSSGGYYIKGVQEFFFEQETYEDPFFIAFVALNYLENYDTGLSLADLFQEPYASLIPGLFDGTKTGSQINGQLTTVIADLLTEDFLNNIDTNPIYTPITDAFAENSPIDWNPQKPVYLYHGTADITVPYQNSVYTYNYLLDNGADETLVTFTDIVDEDHRSGGLPYFLEVLNVFFEIR